MTPEPNSSLVIYDQNFNGLGETIEAFNKSYEDERITRSKGKEIFTFQVMSTSAIYKYLKVENIVEFGGRWFRIKYLEDDDSIKGLTTFTCYALWYELSEGMPTSLSIAASNLQAVATQIIEPFGKWARVVIPSDLQSKSVRGITLKENSSLYKLRYLAKQYELELTFGYEEIIENELRYVVTIVFLQQYAESKLDFPLIVEENLRHISKTEDSRNLITAYKLTGRSENDEEEFTFSSINNGNPYLVDTSWYNRLGVKPRIIPKSKQDDRFTDKQNMLDAARKFLDIYAKPLITYEAGAILYSVIPDLHDSQLIIDDTYDILEWRRVSSRQLNYDDLTSSTILFDDPRQNLMDLINDDGEGALAYQENETARPIIRFADDVLGTNMNDTSGKYIGVITTKKPVEELTPDDFTWILIEGPQGLEGPPGQQGPPGRDGVDGIAGKDGVGIASTDITYYVSTSGITTPTTGWSSSVPTLIKGRYLWTRTIWTYTDGQRETGYQVTYIAQDGNSGVDGLPGKDGVGITSTSITYARSTSGTSAPTSGWTLAVPSVPAGEFLWTKTIWNYSDNTKETGYSVAKMGDTGAKGDKGDPGNDGLPGAPGVGIQSTTSTYGLSANETTQPATWSATVPALIKGQYLWTKNVWTYTDGRTETGYTKTYIAKDGNNGTNGIAGKDGVGISSTSITYASSSSGTTAPSSGWSTSVPNVSQGQYLWTKTIWSYTDNTTETGYSVAKMGINGSQGPQGPQGLQGIQGPKGDTGIQGPKGADGKTQYTHIAYADNATGGGFSQTDQTKAYIGMYQDFTATDSNNPASYKWTKWKGTDGDQGIPGPKGADGKTPYVHFAYADNADGTGLTLTDNGQRYQGYYSDYTQADSTDKTKYRWSDRLAQADPSDRNLTLNTSYKKNPLGWVQNGVNYEIRGDYLKLTLIDLNGDKRIYKEEPFTVTLATGDWINVSYEAYGSKNGIRFRAQTYDTPQVQWKTLTTVPTIYDSAFQLAGSRTLSLFIDGSVGDVVYIRFIKTRKGKVMTPWTPAPEDIEKQLDSKADQELTDQQLNMLIEKAQTMETELKARAAMETLSDLERAYNAYVEDNDKAVAKSQEDLIAAGRRVDVLVEDIGGLKKTKKFIETYITEAEEGIIIGTNDNVSQIRVTYDRIAMYSAGREVMYISQGVIHIDNGVFTKTLQIGRFRTEQHSTNLDINVCRYLG